MPDYKALLPFCTTPRQLEVMQRLVDTNSQYAVAIALNITRSAVRDSYRNVLREAEKRLWSPEHGLIHPVPENFTGDFTIQRNAEGVVERSWMKGKSDKAKQHQQYLEFINGLNIEIKPAKKQLILPKRVDSNLATAIILGDAHLGMLAHQIETLGADHDLTIAIHDIKCAVDYCVAAALPSEEGWFVNVGDFLHANDTTNRTESGHNLDMAARQNQVMKAAGMLIRYCISAMLTKFKHITIINARGNHDRDAAFALNMYIGAVYEKEPRVTVLGNDSKFNFIEFGRCLIGVNHGDKINASRLCGTMTRRQAEAWGRSVYRRWWLGHIHHKTKQEHDSGITLESFHTLAPGDAWHSDSGYGAEQRITMKTLHKKHGEIAEITPTLDMVREAYA